MALNLNMFNLKWPVANLKWPQPEMALTWNGQIQPEMASTWNGPNLKWPNLKWPTWNGQPEMAQPEVGYTPVTSINQKGLGYAIPKEHKHKIFAVD